MLDDIIFKGIDIVAFGVQNPISIIAKYSNKIRIERNLSYFDLDKDCKLDLIRPRKKKDLYPIIINVHGGGFIAGLKEARTAFCYFLSSETECAVLNLEYGKSPKNNFLESAIELSKVFNFIKENANKYNLDASKIAVTGDSSGAFFALYLNVIANNKELQKVLNLDYDLKVSASVLDCGFYSFSDIKTSKMYRVIVDELFNKVLRTTQPNLKNSPLFPYISPFSFLNSDCGKFYIVYSENDLFCAGQSQLLIEKLQENKLEFKTYVSDNKLDGHIYPMLWVGKAAKEFNQDFILFIKELFK